VTPADPAQRALDELTAQARGLLDRIRFLVLGTTDPDGRPRVSPVFFVPHRYADLYWVSHPQTHHSANLRRDPRASAVVHDSTVVPADGAAVYLDGTVRELVADELEAHLPVAFDPEHRGGTAFRPDELVGEADLRLHLLHVERAEVHVRAGHPVLGTGRDRRVAVSLALE
jgi:hypothetical protein